MPFFEGGGKFRIPGAWEQLVVGSCQRGCRPTCHRDPRLLFVAETATPWERMVGEWLKAECVWEAEQDRVARLDARESLVVPRAAFGGHRFPRKAAWPAWLRNPYSGVKTVRVHPDDTIEPADSVQ